jgi:hypothetical protein
VTNEGKFRRTSNNIINYTYSHQLGQHWSVFSIESGLYLVVFHLMNAFFLGILSQHLLGSCVIVGEVVSYPLLQIEETTISKMLASRSTSTGIQIYLNRDVGVDFIPECSALLHNQTSFDLEFPHLA